MDFAYPKILYLLLLIPLIIGLYVLARYSRRRKLAVFGRKLNADTLMPMASKYKPVIKIILESLALAALIIALARPRGGMREVSDERRGIEVMIAFDLSRSMLASSTDDPRGVSRLNRAKYLLSRLVDKLDNDKVGMVIFAGDAYTQLPITSDFLSAKMYIDELSPEMIPTQGTDIGTAIAMCLNGFTPATDVSKAIILITDAEDHIEGAEEMARKAREAGVQVDVIGIGTTKGAPIPLNSAKNDFLKDNEGSPVTTVLNPAVAESIAEAGGGVYVSGSASDALSQLSSHLDKLAKSDFGNVKYSASAEKFPIFIWIAVILLVADIFFLDRKIGWLAKINFFTRTEK